MKRAVILTMVTLGTGMGAFSLAYRPEDCPQPTEPGKPDQCAQSRSSGHSGGRAMHSSSRRSLFGSATSSGAEHASISHGGFGGLGTMHAGGGGS